jgi:phenazine biosynthesis protein phzE
MLAHQLRHLGFDVTITSWRDADPAAVDVADVLVSGPGPGDPRDPESPRLARMREVVGARLASRRPLLAVCLSHQILADRLGLDLAPLSAPHQGLQKSVDVYGRPASIGFYNTFTARVAPGASHVGDTEIAADDSGDVYALRGPGYASVQGHLESILSRDGLETLERLISHVVATAEA